MKNEILEFINQKYKGSLRFLKPKMFIEKFGEKKYQEVLKETTFLKNEPSLSERIFCILNDIKNHPKCEFCLNEVKYGTGLKTGYPLYCCNECRCKDFKKIKEKAKKTNLEKYGATNFLASEQGKEIIKKNNLKKYGVENYTQTKEYKDRLISGNIKRNTNTQKTIETYRSKYYEELNKKYPLFEPLFSKEEYKGAASYDILYTWKCKVCNTQFERWLNNNYPLICPKCKPKGTYFENYFKVFFEKYNIKYNFRDRHQIPGMEIDFYFPDYHTGMEINGLYWHSEKNLNDKKYHLKKTEEASKKGIKLIQIFEDELYEKMSIVLSRIKHFLKLKSYKIYARKCSVQQIDNCTRRKFVTKTHIQGDTNSKFNYGLFYKNRLVAVMCFHDLRQVTGNKKENNHYELTRYCTLKNFKIIGGAGKLLSHFIKDKSPKFILSYADRRWSDGSLYDKLGFTLKGHTNINYWYTKNYKERKHRFNFQKHLLFQKIKNFNSSLTEVENMKNNGYTRIWDCGHLKYIKNFSTNLK